MSKLSRRSLAKYAADQLTNGSSVEETAKKLAAALVENGQQANLDYLMSDIAAELESRGQLAVSQVTSARPLSAELRQQLIAKLKQSTGVEAVLLEEQVDKQLVGGLRVETAGKVWDSSLRRKLQQLKEIA